MTGPSGSPPRSSLPDNAGDGRPADSSRSFGNQFKKYAQTAVRHESFVLVVILVLLMVAFNVISKGVFGRPANLVNIIIQSSTRSLAAVGQALVILTAGIDLSVGGVAILAVTMGGALMTATPGFLGPVPMGVGVLVMLLVGAGFGAINGVLVSRLRVPSLIVTLATWQMALGIGSHLTAMATGKPAVIIELPKALAFLGQRGPGGVPTPVVVFIAAIAIGYFVLNHTTFGKSIYGVGDNETAAYLSGIKTKNIKFWVYLISGFCAAIAGLLQMGRVLAASDALLGSLELDSIAAVVVGGVSLFGGSGSLIGVLIGVLIIGVINNGMNIVGLNVWTQNLVKGSTIFAAVAVDAWRRNRRGG
jgi:ribose/xylose/arabinose/galactoside ABC-type transport system permease subunit